MLRNLGFTIRYKKFIKELPGKEGNEKYKNWN